jgi:hypothetical protein
MTGVPNIPAIPVNSLRFLAVRSKLARFHRCMRSDQGNTSPWCHPVGTLRRVLAPRLIHFSPAKCKVRFWMRGSNFSSDFTGIKALFDERAK